MNTFDKHCGQRLTEKSMALGRFLYGNWYGAVVVFAVVTAVLCGLQSANSCMGDLVPWPKGLHNARQAGSTISFMSDYNQKGQPEETTP